MNDETVNNRGQMIDTTDCLEAVGVFRGWKNFFFLIVLIGLLIVGTSFWLVNTGMVTIPPERLNPPDELSLTPKPTTPALLGQGPAAPARTPTATDANSAPGLTTASSANLGPVTLAWLTFERLTRIIELVNGILVIAALLFCLTMFFSLIVSLIGRLGGINHISRAFFLSLVMAVLMMPWQKVPGMNVPGVIYTPSELIAWFSVKTSSSLNTTVYYLRFVGYWLIVALLLLLSQLRSARWTKAILRRLEII